MYKNKMPIKHIYLKGLCIAAYTQLMIRSQGPCAGRTQRDRPNRQLETKLAKLPTA